jgi:CheY-like chemotaxis protein
VVEDDLDMQLLIQSVLGVDPRLDPWYGVATVKDAVAAAVETSPALIILDHFLGGEITGLDAAPIIKAVAPNARIILFSSHDLSAEVRFESAVDLYVPKTDLRRLLCSVLQLAGLEPRVML